MTSARHCPSTFRNIKGDGYYITNLRATNIVNGTLAIANGGTGATTAAGILTNLGITATAAELNYVDGVTSNIQTQLNNKAPAYTYSSTDPGAGSSLTTGKLYIVYS